MTTSRYVVAPRVATQGMVDNVPVCATSMSEIWEYMLAAIPDDPAAPVLVERETHDLAMAHVKQLEETVARQAAELEALRRLLKEVHTTMNHAEVFIATREKMHPTGQELYRELLEAIDAAIKERGT